METHLERARKVAFMDLHTGIGPWCEHIYLCFHPEGSPARERARAWWGERAVNLQGVTHKKLATYSGTIIDAFAEMLPQAEVTSVVVEFGTRPRHEMQRASMAQRWMRFEGPRDPVLAAQGAARVRGGVLPGRSGVAPGGARAVARIHRPRRGGRRIVLDATSR